MNQQQKAEWLNRRIALRKKMAAILQKIDSGEVSEMELAQLHNYVMTTLMLLSKITLGTWEAAKKETEIAAYIKGEVFDVYIGEDDDSTN